MKCLAMWKQNDKDEWVWKCNKYLMSRGVEFQERYTKCYHWKCEGRKNKPVLPDDKTCHREGCGKELPKDRPKYCSKSCQKKQNDRDYRARKRKERDLIRIEDGRASYPNVKSSIKGQKVSVYVNAELLEALNRYCEKHNTGKSKTIQDALKEFL